MTTSTATWVAYREEPEVDSRLPPDVGLIIMYSTWFGVYSYNYQIGENRSAVVIA